MMDLFDPKFVRVKPDESLIGKMVFFSDSLDELKTDVDSRTGVHRTLHEATDCAFIDDEGHTWDYIYYDPLYEIKVAYSQGKQIQLWFPLSGKWEDVEEPQWHGDRQYRIKPEETWRPYKDFDEFLDDVQERFPTTRNRPAGTMPLVWVQLNTSIYRLITGYVTNSGGAVFELSADMYTCDAMFNMFTYMDGTPFGKKE